MSHTERDTHFLRESFRLAEQAAQQGIHPFAAILVDADVLHLVVFFGMQIYLFLALRRIYVQGWLKPGVKFFLLTGAYNTVLFTLLVLVAVSTAELMELRETHPMLVQWILY